MSLRETLVQAALQWEQQYGIAPAITSALSEYDAATLVGCSEEEYRHSLKDRTSVSKGHDFIFNGSRYQVKANRPGKKKNAFVTLIAKAKNYEWDFLIWVLYNSLYQIEEAWLFDVETYIKQFHNEKYVRPKHMRTGVKLFPKYSGELPQLNDWANNVRFKTRYQAASFDLATVPYTPNKQAHILLKTIQALGSSQGVSTQEWEQLCGNALKSTQTLGKVAGFYAPEFLKKGYIIRVQKPEKSRI